ncbi:MAG: hypothetical protein ACLSA6_19980 [Holdemania massiliensis]
MVRYRPGSDRYRRNTLLGADDKAGIADILTMAETLLRIRNRMAKSDRFTR